LTSDTGLPIAVGDQTIAKELSTWKRFDDFIDEFSTPIIIDAEQTTSGQSSTPRSSRGKWILHLQYGSGKKQVGSFRTSSTCKLNAANPAIATKFAADNAR
jgi:hypothetical protein